MIQLDPTDFLDSLSINLAIVSSPNLTKPLPTVF